MAFNIMIVGQAGRLSHEAALFAATLRHNAPRWQGRLIVTEPRPGPLWSADPRIPDGPQRALLLDLGAEIVPFENRYFGESYPNGNKIEGLAALPEGPFVFFDTDTVITAELADIALDPTRPAASMRRENTWPQVELYGPGLAEIWGALHARCGGRLEGTLDEQWPIDHWKRYLYFNAGWFFHDDPEVFCRSFLDAALILRDDPPPEAALQGLNPWLDQAALPLAIHKLGGGRPGEKGGIAPGIFDGSHSFHYRYMPLMYATAPDDTIAAVQDAVAPNAIKRVLKDHDPFKRFLYQGKGARARDLFDRTALPRREQAIRNRLKRENLWVR